MTKLTVGAWVRCEADRDRDREQGHRVRAVRVSDETPVGVH